VIRVYDDAGNLIETHEHKSAFWLLLLTHMFFVSMSRYDEAEETLTLLRQSHSAFTAKP
jgi:hypothetical protein